MARTRYLGEMVTRRGAVIPLVAISSVVLVGMAALAVDIGILYRARTELQVSADAAALAGASKLLDESLLKGTLRIADKTEIVAIREQAAACAARNQVMGDGPTVDLNPGNLADGDVVVGHLDNPLDLTEPLSTSTTEEANTVWVRVRRNDIRNGPIDLVFASIFGIRTANLGAEAAACLRGGAIGFEIPGGSTNGTAPIAPFALQKSAWTALLAGTLSHGDHYSYDEVTDTVKQVADGIHELNVYPGSATGGTQIGPGNFGTLQIGKSDNSTSTLTRQIIEGLNAEDLSHYEGGQLRLGDDGTLPLYGNVGLSAGIENSVDDIIGQTRVLPLFDTFTGTGAGGIFRIVGFAGVRILYVRLNGNMAGKTLLIQPAFVVTDSVIHDDTETHSTFVYHSAQLVR
jgi:hypothetical protein